MAYRHITEDGREVLIPAKLVWELNQVYRICATCPIHQPLHIYASWWRGLERLAKRVGVPTGRTFWPDDWRRNPIPHWQ